MNSKTLQYHGKIEIESAPGASISRKIRNWLQAWDQAWTTNRYRLQQERLDQKSNGDIIRAMPVEEKLRLGLYHFMD